MMLNSAVAHLLVAWCLFVATGMTAAQSAPQEDPVKLARQSSERALAAGDLSKALQAYEQVRGKDPTHGDLLRSIAVARATQLRKDPDPRTRVDACAAILLAGPERSCVDELTKLANDVSIDIGSRFIAADALREAKVAGSDRLFEYTLGQAIDQSPAIAADALGRLSPAIAREPLKRLAADSTNADARYIATMALARMPGDDLVPVLRSVASDTQAAAARLPAYIGLARRGDPEGLKVLNETLPHIGGRERVEAALALIALKDPRGPSLLAEVAKGDQEMVRIDAADAMLATRPKEAEKVLTDALAGGNPWIRARAIRAFASAGLAQPVSIRRALLDKNAAVAVAATRAAMVDAGRPRQ